jgi:hypothetical protein
MYRCYHDESHFDVLNVELNFDNRTNRFDNGQKKNEKGSSLWRSVTRSSDVRIVVTHGETLVKVEQVKRW